MDRITKNRAREIVDDFAKEIKERKQQGAKPTKAVIYFRNERKDGIERDVYYVPIELLRYRKDNGRIASDVLSYEKHNGVLDERNLKSQEIIRKHLQDKDLEKTDELKRAILNDGQLEPAIITCDGFLINGNRRKMVLETLSEEFPNRTDFKAMRVVILPGKGDPGGPPTLLEIEQVENRYQLQSEGKAEYSHFDRALSIRRKIDLGMSLNEQLRDDPIYAGTDDKEFKQAIKEIEDEYLKPLECIDRYLEWLGRAELYETIGSGKEGRWQAFVDYYKSVYKKMSNDKDRVELNISKDETGKIEDAAFKIIRMREISGIDGLPSKVHDVMRKLPKIILIKDSKKQLLRIIDVPLSLSKEECYDKNGNEISEEDKDKKWASENAAKIIGPLKDALNIKQYKEQADKPLDLLNSALDKLNHPKMEIKNMRIGEEIAEAMKVSKEIQGRAHEIEQECYACQKSLKELIKKHRNK